MSLIGSLLSLVLIPLKAKPPAPPKEAENLAVMALAREVKCLQFALDHWRDSGHALWEENQRLREERNTLALELGYQRTRQQMDNQLWAYAQQNAFAHCTCTPSRAQAFGLTIPEPLPR